MISFWINEYPEKVKSFYLNGINEYRQNQQVQLGKEAFWSKNKILMSLIDDKGCWTYYILAIKNPEKTIYYVLGSFG